MKRLLRIFAFLGSVGVIGWLVRNRIVSVTMNREPEKPEPAPEPAASGPSTDSLTRIDGISASEADQLRQAGITTARRLSKADTTELSKRTGLDEARLSVLKEQAAALV